MKKTIITAMVLIALLSALSGCSQGNIIPIEQSEESLTQKQSETTEQSSKETVALTVTPEPEEVVVRIDGSTSMEKIVQELAEKYTRIYPNITFEVEGRGATNGIQLCLDGECDIAMVSRELTEEEIENDNLIATTICRQGLALGVNKNNVVNGLTIEQIQDVFEGNITDWSEVGGDNGEIHLYIVDESYNSLFEYCFNITIETNILLDGSHLSGSQGYSQVLLMNEPLGITFVLMDSKDLNLANEYKKISIDGVAPTYENIQSGKYSQYRNFNLVTLGSISEEVKNFIDFCMTDSEALEYIRSEGLVVP